MMKKVFYTSTLLFLLSFSAQAQYLGLKGGLNFSNLFVEDANDENLRFGYHGGLYLSIPLSEGLSFQPEVLYSTKGATAKYDVLFFQGENTIKLDYVDVPLLAIIKLGDFAEIQAGPYVGFLLNSSVSTDGDFGDDQQELDNDGFKKLDIGLAGGLAINLNALQIGARYNYGLTKVADSDVADAFLGDARNAYIQVFAALRIGNYD